MKTVHDLPRLGQPTVLTVVADRWSWACACPSGPDRRRQRHPNPLAGLVLPATDEQGNATMYTLRLMEYLVDSWARGETRKRLAQEVDCSDPTLRKLLERQMPAWRARSRYNVAQRQPQYLGLDEVFWRGQAITVIMDIGPLGAHDDPRQKRWDPFGRVIDILPSREPLALEHFFRQLKAVMAEAGHADWRPVITSDMWSDFRLVIRRVFGGRAVHVADRFHVAAKIAAEVVDVGERHELYLTLPQGRRFARPDERRAAARLRDPILQAYREALKQERDPAKVVQPATVPRSSVPEPRTGPKVPFGMRPRQDSTSLRAAPAASRVGRNGALADSTRRLIALAAELDFLWANGLTQMQSVARFRAWCRDVGAWVKQYQPDAQPFRDLIYLLDRDAWIIEVTNYKRPEAVLNKEVLRDPAGVRAPEARPPEDRRASTARVEALNRAIRALEEKSPNHRRNPYASKSWNSWNEKGLFLQYRERLLYALNAPPPPRVPETLEWFRSYADEHAPPDECPACDQPWPMFSQKTESTLHRRSGWDIPLGAKRVKTTWTDVHWTCPRCGAVAGPDITDPVLNIMTPALRDHLDSAILDDHTITGLHRATGVPVHYLQALEDALPEVVPPPLPADIGVLLFRWSGSNCLFISDINSGRPVDLLRFPRADLKGTAACLHEWLAHGDRSGVKRVWVESARWLPEDGWRPDGPRFVLDDFSRARVIQRAVQALQSDFTQDIHTSIRRTPDWKGHRRVLLATTNAGRWPLMDRIYASERTSLRMRMLDDSLALAFGLRMIADLKASLIRSTDSAALETWLAYVDQCHDEETQRFPDHAAALQRARHALLRITVPLQASGLQRAFVEGAQADGRLVTHDRTLSSPEAEQKLSLARTRRRLKDLRETRAFKARDKNAWKRLKRVALSRIGRKE